MVKLVIKTTEEIDKILSFDKKTRDEIDNFLCKKWISFESLKEALDELKSLIEFNLYGEGWDDKGVNDFIEETVDKIFSKIKGDNNANT